MNTITSIFRPSWNLSSREEDSDINPGRQIRIIIFSIVGIVGAAIWLFYFFRNPDRPSATHIAPFAALGQVTAEEAAKLLGSKGHIVVAARDTSRSADNTTEEELKAFQQAISKERGIAVVAVEKLYIDPEVPASEQGMSFDDYSNLVQKYPEADAIVSFVGPPILNRQQDLPQKMPKFIAVSLESAAMKYLFQKDVIQVAIVNRMEPSPQSSTQPASTRAWFDEYFQVITADNADSLPL